MMKVAKYNLANVLGIVCTEKLLISAISKDLGPSISLDSLETNSEINNLQNLQCTVYLLRNHKLFSPPQRVLHSQYITWCVNTLSHYIFTEIAKEE
jgi:hypothetical protein